MEEALEKGRVVARDIGGSDLEMFRRLSRGPRSRYR
jgi:hypothetical protein